MTIIGFTNTEIAPATVSHLQRNGLVLNRRNERPPVIELSDGTKLVASSDPEGNGPGSYFTDGTGGLGPLARRAPQPQEC